MSSVRIAVLTDDRFFCEALLRVLRETAELEVTTFGDEVVLAAVRAQHHFVILDARVRDAVPLCRALSASGGPSVIFVGAAEDDGWACRALDAGARGILTKASHVDDVVNAIHVVRDGGIWCRRRWLYAWVRHQQAVRLAACVQQLDTLLSRREREVFHDAALGAGNKQIADRLSISEATVKAHLTRIFQKLGVNGRAELAAAYYGLLGATPQRSYDERLHGGGSVRSNIPPSAN